MFSIIRNVLGAFGFFIASLSFAQIESGYERMFVLGDSLSDQQNLASSGLAPFLAGPPYFEGAFSNGPVAVELLAESLGLELQPSLHLTQQFTGTNFAVAGAKAGGSEPIDLNTQLGALLAVNPGGFTPGDLFIVFFGGNDIRGTSEQSNRDAFRTLYDATKAIQAAVEALIAAGAENIVIVNSPNIGDIPETQLLAAENPRLPRILSFRSRVFNFFLNRSVRTLKRQNDAQIVQFNLFQFFTFLTNNGDDLGYANSSDACFLQIGASQIFNPECDFDEFLFFDAIHPTAVTHARAANALEAVIPFPADTAIEIPELEIVQ